MTAKKKKLVYNQDNTRFSFYTHTSSISSFFSFSLFPFAFIHHLCVYICMYFLIAYVQIYLLECQPTVEKNIPKNITNTAGKKEYAALEKKGKQNKQSIVTAAACLLTEPIDRSYRYLLLFCSSMFFALMRSSYISLDRLNRQGSKGQRNKYYQQAKKRIYDRQLNRLANENKHCPS